MSTNLFECFNTYLPSGESSGAETIIVCGQEANKLRPIFKSCEKQFTLFSEEHPINAALPTYSTFLPILNSLREVHCVNAHEPIDLIQSSISISLRFSQP